MEEKYPKDGLRTKQFIIEVDSRVYFCLLLLLKAEVFTKGFTLHLSFFQPSQMLGLSLTSATPLC